MAGVNKGELLEEGFLESDLTEMKDWDECIEKPIEEGYLRSENILTSVSYHFVRFGIQFVKMLGIEIFTKNLGL